MRLQDEISEELWASVSKPYLSGIYSSAILESIHHLSNLIREKSNSDGDGAALVGQAFGGDNPRIRINKFQTETEKNEQKGLEAIVRGIYQGIRNPRSHSQAQDTKQTADAVIMFVNYIINIIGQSKSFSVDEWVKKIIDRDFLPTQRYAEILISELPRKRYFDALVEILRNKNECIYEHVALIFDPIFIQLNEAQKQDLLRIISDDLRVEREDHPIELVLKLLHKEDWTNIDELARLRIENRLIRSIKEGEIMYQGQSPESGKLGLQARRFMDYFALKEQLHKTLASKLLKQGFERNYALFFVNELKIVNSILSKQTREFFLQIYLSPLPIIARKVNISDINSKLVTIISDEILGGSKQLKKDLLSTFGGWPDDWQRLLLDNIKPLAQEDTEYVARLTSLLDDLPF